MVKTGVVAAILQQVCVVTFVVPCVGRMAPCVGVQRMAPHTPAAVLLPQHRF